MSSSLRGGNRPDMRLPEIHGYPAPTRIHPLRLLWKKGQPIWWKSLPKKYIPVPPEEFCGNRIRRMEEEQSWLCKNLPREKSEEDGYITVDGEEHIRDRIHNLLEKAEERVYLSCSADCLEQMREILSVLREKGRKIVLITDRPFTLDGAVVYVTEEKDSQIGLITDSRYVLSGEYGPGSMNTCLYSGQKNFVRLFKSALANEIELIKIRKGETENE